MFKMFFFSMISTSVLFLHQGVFAVDDVSVMEGDSVTLNTDIKKTPQDRIRWYFNGIRIAQINGDPRKTCTDVKCNEGNERFKERLKLDNKTGSLTITNIRSTDSGEYQLKIFSSNSISEKTFSISVYGFSADAEMKKKSVKEGESVTLDPGAKKKPSDVMTWYFNGSRITEITVQPDKNCTEEVQCDERFRDRLKVDHQTGSLTIINTRTTDSGEYKLKISSGSRRLRRSISSIKSFTVTVTDSGVSSAYIAGICAAAVLLLVFAAVGGIYLHHKRSSDRRGWCQYNLVTTVNSEFE